jgi:peptidyl-prolyl cis-trans isomerase B (cyclophilin B)
VTGNNSKRRRKVKKLIKITGVLMLMMVMVLTMAGCGGSSEEAPAEEPAETEQAEEPAAEPIGIHHAEIVIKDFGTVKVELDGDKAPITVQNFMDLANAGFYDGLTFHRIMEGFMIQGGDPNGDGTGGSDKNIKGEFAANGVNNDISHKKGVISMARAQDPDSASSQFFIVQEDSEFLDGQYAAFGHVTEGMEFVDIIAKEAKPVDDNGTIPKEEQPVIETIRIID